MRGHNIRIESVFPQHYVDYDTDAKIVGMCIVSTAHSTAGEIGRFPVPTQRLLWVLGKLLDEFINTCRVFYRRKTKENYSPGLLMEVGLSSADLFKEII